jgi:hypothetical protein
MLPASFSQQVSTITESASGDISMHLTTPVSFLLGSATNLHAKFVAIASVIRNARITPGETVDVSVPSELAVTPPKK